MSNKPSLKTPLDNVISDLEQSIIATDQDDDNYPMLVDKFTALCALKKDKKPSTELKDWLPIIGSVSGILIIVTFEAFGHTLTSKSLGFTGKMKN